MTLPTNLWSLLRDPLNAEPLDRDGDRLVNRKTQQRYAIVDSIPVLFDPSELGPQNRKINKMYRWMSRGFDLADRMGNLVTGGMLVRSRREFAAQLALKPGHRCLYTSIGTGLDLPYLAEQLPLNAIEFVGLDLSMEMLQQCRKKNLLDARTSLLVQANAERLPFADGVFDVVFHLGGINLFDRPAQAVGEMVRVAKRGALIVYADETKDVIRKQYQQSVFTRSACQGVATDFDPSDWVPPGVSDLWYREVLKGKGYAISFRT